MNVLFDGSFDGFLCIVHAYYYRKICPLYIQEEGRRQQTLDAEEYYVAADETLAARVMAGIQKKISPDAAHYIYRAHLADEDEDRYMDMFRYLRLGFTVGAAVDSYLREDFVRRVHKLARLVGREAHLLSGFCRFAETRQGIYYCTISPKNHVLPLLAEHFRDRFMNHAWVVHDKKRGLAALYDGNAYIIEPVPDDAGVVYSDEETRIQDLWKAFFTTIGIAARRSYKRQRQHVPLYFREQMTEFMKRV